MVSPYVSCPFTRQGTMDMLQFPGYPTQVPGFPVQQFNQPFMQMPQYYQTQQPFDFYENMSIEDIGPLTASPGDPPPILSNNPAVASISLFKELTGYPNYGNPSRNADILYTGNRGSWTFESPAFLFVPGNLRAQLVIRGILDDHENVPANRYTATITINNSVVHNGRLDLPHGRPAGGIFTNWRELIFNIPNLRRSNRVTIENTSNAGSNDWIAFDWMELRLLPR